MAVISDWGGGKVEELCKTLSKLWVKVGDTMWFCTIFLSIVGDNGDFVGDLPKKLDFFSWCVDETTTAGS